MPAELLESELFGNGRTSSLSTSRTNPGKFEHAEKGTLFLDEIAEMPLRLQAMLMQVLQDKLLLKSGSDKAASVDVRILAATSANIERALAERKLREDLYYRLSAFIVQVPPLRQRKSEIAVLLQHSMHKLARHYGLPPREFSATVLDACQHYSWPGNLKELDTFVKRYLVAGDNQLTFGELKPVAGSGIGPYASDAARLVALPRGTVDAEEYQSGPKSLKS